MKRLALGGLLMLGLLATTPLASASDAVALQSPPALDGEFEVAWPICVALRDHTVTVTIDGKSIAVRTPFVRVCVD